MLRVRAMFSVSTTQPGLQAPPIEMLISYKVGSNSWLGLEVLQFLNFIFFLLSFEEK